MKGKRQIKQGATGEADFFAKFGTREAENTRLSNALLLKGLGYKGLGNTTAGKGESAEGGGIISRESVCKCGIERSCPKSSVSLQVVIILHIFLTHPLPSLSLREGSISLINSI